MNRKMYIEIRFCVIERSIALDVLIVVVFVVRINVRVIFVP